MSWVIIDEGHTEEVDGTVGFRGLRGTIWGRGTAHENIF